jgi:hypothetical protein
MCLGGLARCELMAGNLDAARDAARACETIRARGGDEAARVFPLHVLAYADYIEGNDDAARAGFQRTLAMNRRLGVRWRQAQELTNLCSVETRAGNLQQARKLGREALEIAVEVDHTLLLPYCGSTSPASPRRRAGTSSRRASSALVTASSLRPRLSSIPERRSNTGGIAPTPRPHSVRSASRISTRPDARWGQTKLSQRRARCKAVGAEGVRHRLRGA